jgi:hypothetical protein
MLQIYYVKDWLDCMGSIINSGYVINQAHFNFFLAFRWREGGQLLCT